MKPFLTFLFSLLFVGCKLPEIQIATEEPLKIDIDVRLDVYQYSGDKPGEQAEAAELEQVVTRQTNRIAEIQELKDNRLIGENHRGLLTIRENPGGEWGDYVVETVEAENADRTFLMRNAAEEQNKMLHEIEQTEWEQRTSNSFEGEWIEIPGEKEGTFVWKQVKK